MKKHLVVSFVIVMCLMATAGLFGFEKGTKSIGGGLSFENYNPGQNLPSTTGFSLYPNLSYFVTKNLCVDLNPVLTVASTKSSGSQEKSSFLGLGLGFGLRYFYKNVYGGGSLSFTKSGPKGHKTNQNYYTLKAGYLHGIAKNIYLDTSIGYTHGFGTLGTYEYDGTTISNKNESRSFRIGTGIEIFFN